MGFVVIIKLILFRFSNNGYITTYANACYLKRGEVRDKIIGAEHD